MQIISLLTDQNMRLLQHFKFEGRLEEMQQNYDAKSNECLDELKDWRKNMRLCKEMTEKFWKNPKESSDNKKN